MERRRVGRSRVGIDEVVRKGSKEVAVVAVAGTTKGTRPVVAVDSGGDGREMAVVSK